MAPQGDRVIYTKVDAGGAQLSSVRRHGGRVEARLWNPYRDRSIDAWGGGGHVRLGPARVETVGFDRS